MTPKNSCVTYEPLMANTQSAIKRVRQNKKKRDHNRSIYSEVTTAIRTVEQAIQRNDAKSAQASLNIAIPLIDKAAQKNMLHRNNASRKISRLTVQVNSLNK